MAADPCDGCLSGVQSGSPADRAGEGPAPVAAPPVLLLPGWQGSGPDHWQSRWQRLHPHWRTVDFGSWQEPDRAGWIAALEKAVRACPAPPLLIAHSLGCHAAAGLLARPHPPAITAALLVAPPDPGRADTPAPLRPFHPPPCLRFPAPGLLAYSSDDPYASEACSLALAGRWGLEPLALGPCGHINADSDLDDWPLGLALVERLLPQGIGVLRP